MIGLYRNIHKLGQEHIGKRIHIEGAVEIYNCPDQYEISGTFKGLFIERAVAEEEAFQHYYGKLTLVSDTGRVVNVIFDRDTTVTVYPN